MPPACTGRLGNVFNAMSGGFSPAAFLSGAEAMLGVIAREVKEPDTQKEATEELPWKLAGGFWFLCLRRRRALLCGPVSLTPFP